MTDYTSFDRMKGANIPRWLGITQQQFEILISIFRIQMDKRASNPKNILNEYNSYYQTKLKRQNLFTQMKPLIDTGMVLRVEKASYSINIDKLKEVLKDREQDLKKDMDSFKGFSKNLEYGLNTIASEPTKPEVTYLASHELFESVASSLHRAKVYYADSPFPNLFYPYELAKAIDRVEFWKMQRERCMEKEGLKINYLTNLKIEFPFMRAIREFGDVKKAYRTCKLLIREVDELSESKMIDLRYLKLLPGPHMYVMEFTKGKPEETSLAFRDSNVYRSIRDPYAGVRIRSPDIAQQAKEHYLRSFDTAKEVEGNFKEKLLKGVKDTLDDLYNIQTRKQK